MNVTKAVFPVAGLGTRFLPATKANPKEMMPIVDKPLIQYAVEEAVAAGITELIFVTSSSKRAIEDHFDSNYELESNLLERGKFELLEVVRSILPEGVSCAYIRQKSPQGLGHAVLCARQLVGNEPFAVLLADDLIDSGQKPCLSQMVEAYQNTQTSVIAVQQISLYESKRYGVIDIPAAAAAAAETLTAIRGIVEKPYPHHAPSNLGVVGRYILSPRIFTHLEKMEEGSGGEIQLTDAIATLLKEEAVYALQFSGKRYDCGNKLGYLEAVIAYAMRHPEVGESFKRSLRELTCMHGVVRKHFMIYGVAVFISLLLSAWAALKTSVINPDAICYLYSAAAMTKGFVTATHLCAQAKWPFYSMLIFGVSYLTHLSYLSAAYLLDGFFSAISVVTFIAVVSTLTLRTRIVALSAMVILLAHGFNSLRVEILRDHGFWAFYLLSLLFLLRYFNVPATVSAERNRYQWCYAILWSISLVIAALFRIEGIFFLALVPLLTFFESKAALATRLMHFFQLNGVTFLGCILLLTWIIVHPEQYLGRLPEVSFQLSHGVTEMMQAFHQLVEGLSSHVLNIYSAHDANQIALAMLLSWYVISVIANVSLIYAGLIIYAWWKKAANFTSQNKRIIWIYIIINILITFVFLVDNLFLAKRYLIALSLVLTLWVPFALDDLIQKWRIRRWPLLLAIILIGIYGLGGIFNFGHSKKYVRDAGDWLAVHAPAYSKIYSNDFQVLYYSQHVGADIFKLDKAFADLQQIAQGKWRQYDYLALRMSKSELTQKNGLLREINVSPISVFQNERGDQVRIYQIQK